MAPAPFGGDLNGHWLHVHVLVLLCVAVGGTAGYTPSAGLPLHDAAARGDELQVAALLAPRGVGLALGKAAFGGDGSVLGSGGGSGSLPGPLSGPLALGVQLLARDGNGATALHWAARSGSVAVLRRLLDVPEFRTVVNARDAAGRTALHVCAPDPEPVRELLQAGADAAAVAVDGATVLHAAVEALGKKLSVEAADDTPHPVAFGEDTGLLEAPPEPSVVRVPVFVGRVLEPLARAGADPFAVTHAGDTLTDVAAAHGPAAGELVRMLGVRFHLPPPRRDGHGDAADMDDGVRDVLHPPPLEAPPM